MGIDILLFLILGVFVGTFGTLVGIGGGLICVPIFIFFLSDGGIYPYFHTAAQITGTSLVIVLAKALSGTPAYKRQKREYIPAAVPFALATLPGAFLGSYIVDDFTGPMLYISFGAFLLIMACMMYWNATHKTHVDVHELPANFTFNRSLGICSSVGVGFLSSIFGIGGGVIHVPLMVYLLNFPVHAATATSHFVLAASAAFGVISHVWLGHVIWTPAICISIGAAVGAQIGAALSRKAKSKMILTLLAAAMFALGLRLIWMSGMI